MVEILSFSHKEVVDIMVSLDWHLCNYCVRKLILSMFVLMFTSYGNS